LNGHWNFDRWKKRLRTYKMIRKEENQFSEGKLIILARMKDKLRMKH
jgi:hypothetical protein